MNLSKFSDYSFRILIYLGNHPNELYTVEELSSHLGLSTHHIKKIIYKLSKNNLIESSKGRNGGIKLVKDPKEMNLGDILEITEDNLNIVECFSEEAGCCSLNDGCRLKPIMYQALDAFKSKLKEYTLYDIL
ncbi:RrF2 family transcriptional regulator [Clostridium sp.]|uniref:RrF2 family transcriptional regulator n=1 Tax=Clostridium sp. TaxID=1506 RepID=UPI003F38FC79